MDSAGPHAIIDAGVRAEHAGHRPTLVPGPADLHRLFALTGTGHDVEVLDLDPDERPACLHHAAITGGDGR